VVGIEYDHHDAPDGISARTRATSRRHRRPFDQGDAFRHRVTLDRLPVVRPDIDVDADNLALADEFKHDAMKMTEPPRATPVSTMTSGLAAKMTSCVAMMWRAIE